MTLQKRDTMGAAFDEFLATPRSEDLTLRQHFWLAFSAGANWALDQTRMALEMQNEQAAVQELPETNTKMES